MTQQQYTGVMEELNIRDDEVARLNTRIKELQSQLREMVSQIEISQERVTHGEKNLSQQAHDYQVSTHNTAVK